MRIPITKCIVILSALAPLCLGQEHPATACQFDGFSANPKLAETVASSIAYYRCANPDCLSVKVQQGDLVIIYRQSADWICGYIDDRKGATPAAWVRAKNLREVHPDPNPPLTAWVGTWRQYDNRLRIEPAKESLKLHLSGQATWHGIAGVVHYGNLDGEVIPSGNHLHYSEGPDACTVDLTLCGDYIIANDNNRCGGMNVRFWGIWTRPRK